MIHAPKTIHVEPGSELDRLLDEAAEGPIELERDGVRFRLSQVEAAVEEGDIWADYDPEAVRAALRAAAGSWSDIDAEELKEYIYRGREEGSRPPDRS